MIIRRVNDSKVVAISQESHADVAAQFAAHWGNERFARLEPYDSMVFGTIYHDSGHRDMEANLPIDPESGLPYNFRGAPPEVRNRESDNLNSLWIRERDPYAALVVSMHHAGLRKRRYDTVRMRKLNGSQPAAPEGPALGIADALDDLQGWQRETADQLGLRDGSRDLFWYNYQLLQVFDLLSLHFCCDGYAGEQLQPVVLERVPVRPGSDELVDIRLEPVGKDDVRFEPYPFDTSPLEISTLGRIMSAHKGEPEVEAKKEYHLASRCALAWQVSS